MRIGIDMRMAGTGEGIARYVEELVFHLSQIDYSNEYFLLCMANSSFQMPKSKNFFKVVVRSKYYSWAEQTRFVGELNRLKLDLVHFPSFNAPILYRGKFIVTIHDLIHHHYPGKKKLRLFHRLAYRWAMRNAVLNSLRIIAVSESTKKDILKHYKVSPGKISVIYEGVSNRFKKKVPSEKLQEVKQRHSITKPYILFVGAWRKYKNVPSLARAFDIIRDKYKKDLELVLVGKEDAFYPEIKKEVLSIKNKAHLRTPGFVSDEDLAALYQGAAVFVLPSSFEGFGLIAVEAETAGIPLAVSDIPVLREILGESALYFDPHSTDDIAEKILTSIETGTSPKINLAKYDWIVTAKKTLDVYNKRVETGSGVVLNKGKVLLVEQEGGAWSLPKGHLDQGETALEAAQREIFEETGVKSLVFKQKLGTYTRYRGGLKAHERDKTILKKIHVFLFTTEQEHLSPQRGEAEQAKWVEVEKASSMLTYSEDKKFFDSIINELKA